MKRYEDMWIQKHFGKEGGVITGWQGFEYIAAILNYYAAGKSERQKMRVELQDDPALGPFTEPRGPGGDG